MNLSPCPAFCLLFLNEPDLESTIMTGNTAPPFLRAVLAAAACLALAPPAAADAVTLHCNGVNYVYPAGIGDGPAERQSAARTITLDLQGMEVELADGSEVRTTPLTRSNGSYQGFFTGKTQVFDTPVEGEQIEIDANAHWMELRYLLGDQRRFLAFTGDCRR